MFVQALAEYADRNLASQMSDEAFEEKPVPVLLELAPDGTFLGSVPRTRQENRGKKTVTLAESLSIGRSPVNRNSGLHPLLAADDIKYVLGPGPWTKPGDEQNALDRYQAFVDLISKASEATRDPALLACANFYARPNDVQRARENLGTAKPGTLIALSTVDGPVIGRTSARDFWRDHYRQAFQGRVESGGVGECLVSGRVGTIAPTHEKIKGAASLGGQASGVSLMSFDKQSFRSYGWEQNANSPVAPDRAMAYVLALNDLLRPGGKHRKDIAGVGFIYWTRQSVAFDPMDTIEQAREEDVTTLLQLDPQADPDPNMFYLAGLAGNGARLLIRYWIAESLAQVKGNLRGWFEGQRVTTLAGKLAPPTRLWQLFYAIERTGEPTARQTLSLMRRAIEGTAQPLGYDTLTAVLSRLRHPAESKSDGERQEYRFTAARLGLVRLCLNDLFQEGERKMTESLDPDQNHSAYLCGRLLAEYENLQETVYRAAGEAKVNMTVADRYYSLASTHPKIAFPKLEGLAKSHFRKLRRERLTAMVAIERRVIELHERIGGQFPGVLSLDEQGRFALGYYHQKAERNQQIAEYKEKKLESAASKEQETEQ